MPKLSPFAFSLSLALQAKLKPGFESAVTKGRRCLFMILSMLIQKNVIYRMHLGVSERREAGGYYYYYSNFSSISSWWNEDVSLKLCLHRGQMKCIETYLIYSYTQEVSINFCVCTSLYISILLGCRFNLVCLPICFDASVLWAALFNEKPCLSRLRVHNFMDMY